MLQKSMNNTVLEYYKEKRKNLETNRYSRNIRVLDKNIRLWKLKKQKRQEPLAIELPWSTFNGVLPEHVTSTIWKYGCFDVSVGTIIAKVVSRGDCVFDVGAHYGYFSQMCSAIVGDTGVVHSFEATPSTARQLMENAQAAQFENVIVINNAVGDKYCDMEFNDFGVVNSSLNSIGNARTRNAEAKPVTVKCITLDDYITDNSIDKVDFIKLDVESSEQFVLAGARNLFREYLPAAAVELGAEGSAQRENMRYIHEFFTEFGYEKYRVDYNGFHKVDISTFGDAYENCLFVNSRNKNTKLLTLN